MAFVQCALPSICGPCDPGARKASQGASVTVAPGYLLLLLLLGYNALTPALPHAIVPIASVIVQ